MREFKIGAASLRLEWGNITAENVEAIVNAANSMLMGGGGVDGAIHKAGGPQIHQECKVIRQKTGKKCPPGEAVITSGGNLKARFVIHTVGPVWRGGGEGEEEILRRAYRNSLELASSKKIQSIAFPSISTGAYGYPAEKAAAAALDEVTLFLYAHPEGPKLVKFILYDSETFSIYEEALTALTCKK